MAQHSLTSAQEHPYSMLIPTLSWIKGFLVCTYAGVGQVYINGTELAGPQYQLELRKQLEQPSFLPLWITSRDLLPSLKPPVTSCTSRDCLQTQHGTQ